jgi:SAM-dependent methyltransferase
MRTKLYARPNDRTSVARDLDKIEDAFRTGKGVGWHEHHATLFEGTEKFFRPGYNANLVSAWIPALDGVEAKLQKGARVADIGCGHGASTIIMAAAYPKSTFFAFDYHLPSIERARQAAEEAGLTDRITFDIASAKTYPGEGYDLVAFFDCLHDMGDPVGAAKHVYRSVAPDGSWMIVEPFAHDEVLRGVRSDATASRIPRRNGPPTVESSCAQWVIPVRPSFQPGHGS